MTPAVHFAAFAENAGPSSSSPAQSSPSKQGAKTVPLGLAKTVALPRRGVYFSPQTDTKYFHSQDSIVPTQKDMPPPSIRSYKDIQSSSSSPAPVPRDLTPSGRGILKLRVEEIRVASSVEEGTLLNKEAARLLVTGKRPRLMARDSFQLSMLASAASDGLSGGEAIVSKEIGKTIDELPSSDDNGPVEDAGEDVTMAEEGSSEAEEEVEENGGLTTSSLVSIILEGAEDLLTLEEAYSTLTSRLRQRIPPGDLALTLSAAQLNEIRMATSPLREEAPALVRAIQRDLQRLLGKVPNAETSGCDDETMPFRGLMPIKDAPTPTRSRITPSPTPTPGTQANKFLSPDGKPLRKGYTESEVRYRREASGVGAATLKFLSFLLSTPHLYGCLSEADITALIDQVMMIPRTPRLPTPNPKRSYYLSIVVIAQLKVPASCIVGVHDKIARSLESALNDALGLVPNPQGAGSGVQIKKEAYSAASNLMSTYPAIFLPHFADILPACLRGLISPAPLMRNKAATALAAITAAKLNVLSDTSSRDTWTKMKITCGKLETFVVTFLKGPVRSAAKIGAIYANNGEKRTEWNDLERMLKETVGNITDVQWACATWACLVTLMGGAYAASGLSTGIDHIMDRSLQPSTNAARPLLARAAWCHAVHAYLTSGSITSISDESKRITSYQPFASAATTTDRYKLLQFPVELAVNLALDASAVTKVQVDDSWIWQRNEKAKKLQWMVTCGLLSATVVYTYTGTALYHQEQPAKAVTAVSGLPSSDGIPVPESEVSEARLDRLDKTWELVVQPMLKSLAKACGVHQLKIHSWMIFDAITSMNPAAGDKWSLDRLLSPKYLAGQAFTVERDAPLGEFLDSLEMEAIKASEIPSWGSAWIVRRFGDLLELFQDLLSGIKGLNGDSPVKWAKDDQGRDIIPLAISRIWSNLIRHLNTIREDNDNTDLYHTGLSLVARHLVQILNSEPESYLPTNHVDQEGKCREDTNLIRLNMFIHLFNVTRAILVPDQIGNVVVPVSSTADDVEAAIVKAAVSRDVNGGSTIAGRLLGQILQTKVFQTPMEPAASALFKSVLNKVIDAGAVRGQSGKLLGDLTNHMPWIFADDESLQLDVWRVLVARWISVIDLQPSASASSTNHTGALLVSLLSCPFRGKQVTSIWHHRASTEDLQIWDALLEVTVKRFRAKRVGSNFGVLESLAGHLSDYLNEGEKTSSSTITLSCLARAAGWIAFVEPQAHHASHFSISENFVPVDFLSLVSKALFESYPQNDTLAAVSQGANVPISQALDELLEKLNSMIIALPSEFVWPVIEACSPGMAVWLKDDAHIVSESTANTLDQLYCNILSALSRAITAGHIAATAETLDSTINLFAPRLSRSQSAEVLKAFPTFYTSNFSKVDSAKMSEHVRQFLYDFISAVPGIISVPGLAVAETLSQEESQSGFPNAQGYIAPVMPGEEVAIADLDITVDATPSSDPQPDTTGDYDADVSQTQQTQVKTRATTRSAHKASPVLIPEPETTAKSSPRHKGKGKAKDVVPEPAEPVPSPSAEEKDVFGPTKVAIAKPKRGRKGKRGSNLRPVGDAESLPEPKRAKSPEETQDDDSRSLPAATPLVPESPEDLVRPAEDVPSHITEPSPAANGDGDSTEISDQVIEGTSSGSQHAGPSQLGQSHSGKGRHSLLNSAKSWFRPVFSGIFSPSHEFDAAGPSDIQMAGSGADMDDQVNMDQDAPAAAAGNDKAPAISEPNSSNLKNVTPKASPKKDSPGSSKSSRKSRRQLARQARKNGQVPSPAPVIDMSQDDEVEPVHKESKGKGRKRSKGSSVRVEASSSDIDPSSQASTEESQLDDEDDDVLLLSPESARKRRREEDEEVEVEVLKRESPNDPCHVQHRSQRLTRSQGIETTPSKSRTRSKGRTPRNQNALEANSPQEPSGRFDNAPESSGSLAQRVSDTTGVTDSPARTTQQQRVLSMLDDAVRSKAVVDAMNFDDLLGFMGKLDELKGVAQKSLERRILDQRAAKKSRREKV